MPKIQVLPNGQYTLTVTQIAKLKGWQKGEKVNFKIDRSGRVYLEKE